MRLRHNGDTPHHNLICRDVSERLLVVAATRMMASHRHRSTTRWDSSTRRRRRRTRSWSQSRSLSLSVPHRAATVA